jgi:hypothetical protein
MNNKIKPALLGGLVTGILSVIPIVSSCCCLWAILGGMLACFLYVKSSPVQVSTGDGAVIGVLSGVFGGLIYLIIGLPIALIFGVAQMEESIRRTGIEVPLTGIALALIGACVIVVILLIFSTIGGLIGVPIFEKRKGAQPPPPPQNVGGGPGSYGSGV